MTACGTFAGRLISELVIVHYLYVLWIEIFQERAWVTWYRPAIFVSVSAVGNRERVHRPRDADVK